MKSKQSALAVAMMLLLAAAAGCATWGVRDPQPLRVGVTPDYPPLAFHYEGRLVGAEIDFARALGQALGRPVVFVIVPWDEQIPYLLAGRTDIIMSGMSITPERESRIAFADPYLGNNLYALVRKRDARRFPSVEDVCGEHVTVGVLAGTTADALLQRRCPGAARVVVGNSSDAPLMLLSRQIDAFIDDGWSLAYLLAAFEADLALARGPMHQEELGWGLRSADTPLRSQVNAALAAWREDGTLVDIVRRWVPNIAKLR